MALHIASRYGANYGRVSYHYDYGSDEGRCDARAIHRQVIELETSLARAWRRRRR